ncbi:TPA: CPBP family intramembrane metalloprotease domain-containing protein [candidate division WOR-3 bacterium]|uniref:CPBP family intramembrane metalloprotease domain-containing protein n=1 Tax=candidate division WOR-3 bacterium TaxID=2052148 RepID=A0A350HBC1_UNCW3|nr:CPBP family intramembrane metalloprotease domain-containing protein [candidate division WOR-3 bacterium]
MNYQKKIPRTLLYSLIAFSFSWIILLLILILEIPFDSPLAGILLIVYMFGPFIASWFVTSVVHKESLTANLGISFKINRWFFVSWFIMILAALLTIAVSVALPSVSFSIGMEGFFAKYADLIQGDKALQMKEQMGNNKLLFSLLGLVQILFAGATINAIAAFGEEAGWRGFLMHEYRDKKFLDATLRIGLLWGAWHAPIIAMGHNYPEHPIIGIFMMIVWCVLLSFIFCYLRIKSKSVIASAVLHGTLNASAGLALLYIIGGNDLTVGMTGLSGFAALLILIGIIFVYDVFISKERIVLSSISEKTVKNEI